jgi:RNA ligase (TIGR02306 family)
MRKLASFQRITAIEPIINADSIVVCSVLGWKVVARKDEFKVGDMAIFFEVDSILPPLEEFAFLAKHSYRLKSARMRGQLSQGLLWDISLLDKFEAFNGLADVDNLEGLDITELLGVTKYEEPFPTEMLGKSKGFHPKTVRKTGEVRVQSSPDLLQEFQGIPVVITTKIEGVSSSYIIHNGEIDVCSHTHSLLPDENIVQWQMAKKYDILFVLKSNHNIAIQGEIAGPGILGNPMGLSEKQFFVFRMFDTETNRRWSPQETLDFCNENDLQFVPFTVISNFRLNLEQVIELAKGDYYPSGTPREGIVITPANPTYSEILCDWLSMKIINNDYLTGEWKQKKRKG